MSTDKKTIETNKAIRDFVADSSKWSVEEQTKVLEIRTGEAQQIEYPIKVGVEGVLTAPFEFYKKRVREQKLHDTNKCHLLVDRQDGKLTLVIDENYSKGTLIDGSVQNNQFLTAFQINTDKSYNAKDLGKLLKMNKIWFADPNQCGQMVHNLQHFEGEWGVRVKNIDNQKGITHSSIERELKSSVPLGFALTIEPFKGFERKTFQVDICVQYQHSDITFYLESIELMQIQLEVKVAKIEEQVALFSDEICIFEI